MKIKLIPIAIGLITLLIASRAFAFEQHGVEKGNLEVAVFASEYTIKPDGGSSSSYFMIGGSAGYFFANPMEVGCGLSVMEYDDDLSYIIRPFFRYHFFPVPTIIPYGGAGLTYMSTDHVDSGLGINIHGGANFFFRENLALAPEINLDLFDDSNVFNILIQFKAYF